MTVSLWLAECLGTRAAVLANHGHDPRALRTHLGHRNIEDATRYMT
jgi:hypothetical protein